MEHQTLGRRFICPIDPVTERGFILDWRISIPQGKITGNSGKWVLGVPHSFFFCRSCTVCIFCILVLYHYFPLLFVVKMSLRRWVVQKSLKTPLRNIKIAPKSNLEEDWAKFLWPLQNVLTLTLVYLHCCLIDSKNGNEYPCTN